MSITLQRICLWSGPLFAVTAFGGMVCAGWLPPVSANQSATTVAAMYVEDTERIRMGAVLMGMSSLFEGAWAAPMSCQLRGAAGSRAGPRRGCVPRLTFGSSAPPTSIVHPHE